MAIPTRLPRSSPPGRTDHGWPVRVISRTRSVVPWVALALVLGGLLCGLLTIAVGGLLAPRTASRGSPTATRGAPVAVRGSPAATRSSPAVMRGTPVIECLGFAAEGQPTSSGAIRLTAPAASGAVLDLYFLDADGTIVRTRHAELLPGAQLSFGVPAREMGSTLWVVGSDAVDVQVALVSPGSSGIPERRPLACTRLPPSRD